MRQSTATNDPQQPPYAGLLEALEARLDDLAAGVAGDVVDGRVPDEAERAASRAAVRWLLDSLRQGPVPGAAALRVLREGAAAQARAGGPVQPVLDRALSAGWVIWSAVMEHPGLPGPALAALGDALLRTGDAAAAAIADGHAVAERVLATRSASALRELLDELLELPDGDQPAHARLGRRLAELGIPADRPLTVVLVDAGRDLEDGDPAVGEVARGLARGMAPTVGDPRALGGPVPGPVVAATRGLLVLLLPTGRRATDPVPALRSLGTGWTAVRAPAPDVPGTAGAVREASAALVVAVRLGLGDRVIEAASLRLERALLAQPALLAAAVDGELGPLERAPRGSGLLETLEVYFAERQNVRAAGRRLGIAPRTVTYRLARVERLLGGRLDADRRLRLATALFARRLVAGVPPTGHAAAEAARPAGPTRAAAAARPR